MLSLLPCSPVNATAMPIARAPVTPALNVLVLIARLQHSKVLVHLCLFVLPDLAAGVALGSHTVQCALLFAHTLMILVKHYAFASLLVKLPCICLN
jgi:hypothetical protein